MAERTYESMQNYEIRWYVTFYDERNQQICRAHAGDGKIAIPLDATYMKLEAELTSVRHSSAGQI